MIQKFRSITRLSQNPSALRKSGKTQVCWWSGAEWSGAHWYMQGERELGFQVDALVREKQQRLTAHETNNREASRAP